MASSIFQEVVFVVNGGVEHDPILAEPPSGVNTQQGRSMTILPKGVKLNV
jgi:hypothetical protein